MAKNSKFNSVSFLIVLLFFSQNILAQSDSLQIRLDKLDLEIAKIQSEMNRLEGVLDSLNEMRSGVLLKIENANINEDTKFIYVEVNSRGTLRSEPSILANTLIKFEGGEQVKILNFYEEPYLKAQVGDTIGYISRSGIEMNDSVKDMIDGYLRETNPRLARLTRKYNRTIAQRILKREIWIGMTDEMARESIGPPRDINRSRGSWGVHEQWVYNNRYLYFENGKLTSWQD